MTQIIFSQDAGTAVCYMTERNTKRPPLIYGYIFTWHTSCKKALAESWHLCTLRLQWKTKYLQYLKCNLTSPVKHTVVYTFISATLLFVKAGEGLLFSPSVAHLEVSMRSKRGTQRPRTIVLYSLRKFWFSSPYMMALRQLLKYAIK